MALLVTGVKGNKYKKFSNEADARAHFDQHLKDGKVFVAEKVVLKRAGN